MAPATQKRAYVGVWFPILAACVAATSAARGDDAGIEPPLVEPTAIISTINHFQSIKEDGYYLLANNIDASATSAWNNGAGFQQIANFKGTLDGQGYTISGLHMVNNAKNNLAPFGTVSGKIVNLRLNNVLISGASCTAGLVSQLQESGRVSRCSVSGFLYGSGSLGGLAAISSGEIEDSCTKDMTIVCTGSSEGSGGLIYDFQKGAVRRCFSIVSHGDEFYWIGSGKGGLIATKSVAGSGAIENCYAGGVVASYRIGGYSGGFMGNSSDASLVNCFSYGEVRPDSANTNAGFVAKSQKNAPTCVWDTENSHNTRGVEGVGAGLTTEALKNADSSAYSGWDFANIWRHPSSDYPRLRWETAPTPYVWRDPDLDLTRHSNLAFYVWFADGPFGARLSPVTGFNKAAVDFTKGTAHPTDWSIEDKGSGIYKIWVNAVDNEGIVVANIFPGKVSGPDSPLLNVANVNTNNAVIAHFPHCTSIKRSDDIWQTYNTNLGFTVNFDMAVRHVDKTDFAATASDGTTLIVSGVTAIPGTSGSAYTVKVDARSLVSGTVYLKLLNDKSIMADMAYGFPLAGEHMCDENRYIDTRLFPVGKPVYLPIGFANWDGVTTHALSPEWAIVWVGGFQMLRKEGNAIKPDEPDKKVVGVTWNYNGTCWKEEFRTAPIPKVAGIARYTPTCPCASQASVQFQVKFDQEVRGFDADHCIATTTLNNSKISVEPSATPLTDTYLVTVTTDGGVGDLQLSVEDKDKSIVSKHEAPLGGNVTSYRFDGETYHVDTSVISAGKALALPHGYKDWNQFNLSSGTASEPNGALQVVDGVPIIDPALFAATTVTVHWAPVTGDPFCQTITVSPTPKVDKIETSGSPDTRESIVTFGVTFSTPVKGVAKDNFVLTADPAITGAQILNATQPEATPPGSTPPEYCAVWNVTVNTGQGLGAIHIGFQDPNKSITTDKNVTVPDNYVFDGSAATYHVDKTTVSAVPAPATPLTRTFTLGYDDPLNPFKHIYCSDASCLGLISDDAMYSNPPFEGGQGGCTDHRIRPNIPLNPPSKGDLSLIDFASLHYHPGHNDPDEYQKPIDPAKANTESWDISRTVSLQRPPIYLAGTSRLNHVSNVETLNPQPTGNGR